MPLGFAPISAVTWADATASASLAPAAITATITTGIPAPSSAATAVVRTILVYSEVDLPDRAQYHYGYKKPTVLQFFPIRRGLSDKHGQMEHMSFGALHSDADGAFRTLLEDPNNKYLVNKPLVEWMVTDPERRLELPARIVANGVVESYSPQAERRFKITGQDILKKRLAKYQNEQSTWQPRIKVEDFPNANGSVTIGSEIIDYANIGMVIPIIYGRITDTNLLTPGDPTSDQGDGQMIPIYVGDAVLSGSTWRTALVCAHYAYIEAAFSDTQEFGVNLETDPNWLTPRNAAAWAAAGFTTPYQTINGQDFTIIYIKGAESDAFVQNATSANRGIAINVWGRTETGRDNGALITDGFEQLYDVMRNYVIPDNKWVAGPALPVPMFPTVPLHVINRASFERCQLEVSQRVAEGYQLNFIIGANNSQWKLGDVIAELHKCLDCEGYIDHLGRYSISMEPTILPGSGGSSTPLADKLTDVLHIIEDGFKIEDGSRDFANVVPFRHTYDYAGRMQSERSSPWRSEMSGVLEVRHPASIALYEIEKSAQSLDFHFIRGWNRPSDSLYYVPGTAQAIDIATRWLYRYAHPRRTVEVQTSLNGALIEPGDVSPVTTIDGTGASGWVDRHVRWTTHELFPSKGQVILGGYDLDAVIDARTAGGAVFG